MEARVLLAGIPLLSAGVLIQDNQFNFNLTVMGDSSPCMGDWNSDGRKDLIVGEYSRGGIQVFLNGGTDANPLFAGSRALMVGNQPLTTSYDSTPQVVDWNNDRRPDLITGEYLGYIRIYLGTASGLANYTYLQTGTMDYSASGLYSKPDVVDWNNDGKKDLIVGDGSGAVSLLLNTGTDDKPTFAADGLLLMGPDPVMDYLSVGAFGAMASPVAVDWNVDGKKDLLVGAADGRIYYFENVGTDAAPAFSGPGVPLAAGGDTLSVGSYATPEVTDWDRNGIVDLICGNSYGYVYYFHAQAAPVLTLSDATITEGDAGTRMISFAATLSKVVDQPVTVHFSTSDGSGTLANNDYLQAEGRLLIPPGQKTGQINVFVVGDTAIESDETFYVDLSDPMGLVTTQDRVTATITNDDQSMVSIEDLTVLEGNTGSTNFDFAVSLSQATDKPVEVMYMIVPVTATAIEDYTPVPAGKLTIPVGQTTGTITVAVVGDTRVELDETFYVYLTSATNAEIASDPIYNFTVPAIGTIVNDDELGLSINDVSKVEGSNGSTTDFVFTVTLSEPMITPVTVQYATEDGSAKAGVDYTAASGTLTIPANQTTATLTVKVNGDTDNEADKTFNLVLSNSNDAALLDGIGVGTIRNDDPVPALPRIAVAVTWPKKSKGSVQSKQKTAVDFGSATLRSEGPGRSFSITNVGDADLLLSKLRMPRGYVLIDPLPAKLVPAEKTTFGVYLNTGKVGTYRGYITFATNVAGIGLFYLPVTGVVKAAKAAAKKTAAAPKAAAAKATFVGVFATSTKRIAADNWLADDQNIL
ncbi:MAG: FG-GAP-like repeat-containing protein [Planctomycetota bacterium]|nr:FG-GAP-like repeat-containing protein [Planctomycetota bacterium]